MPSEALRQGVDWLLRTQDQAGWWSGELQTNVTMTAEHVLLLRFLGVDHSSIRDGAIQHILGAQREDGTWALYHGAPGDLSTTIEAYVALRVLGVDATHESLVRALRFIRALGGLAQARVFTKIWMALFGVHPWDGVPSMPPELVNLPPWMPFNLYDFACWARGTIAPLLTVITRRPVRSLGVDVGEIVNPGTEAAMHRAPGSGPFWWLDRGLKLYDRSPVHPGRARSQRKLVDWITERQEADGSWGGIQPPWVYSLIALDLEGLPLEHPVMRRGLAGLERFSLEGPEGWRLQACMSPVWDTAWALIALRRAGLPREHPALVGGVEWLLAEQVRSGGDWQVRAPGASSNAWAFEFDNDLYPDIDDTAVVVLALLEAGDPARVSRSCAEAVEWCRAMRSRNGAWGAFDKDNTREIVYKLPFADFGALLDPPSEDVTAHILEMLVAVGAPRDDPHVAGALAYLRREQRPAGSWWGRWGVNHIYGTWCVVNALAAARSGHDMTARAAAWMLRRQNPDGGWGEDCHSYEDESFAGVGASSPSQTAWALHTLQLAGHAGDPACRRGLGYLREQQRNGTWEEDAYTGTGFPRDFYINYHLYRHVFPVLTLAAFESGEHADTDVIAGARLRPEPERVFSTAY